jgi:branched-chain amino acid aminotransferase
MTQLTNSRLAWFNDKFMPENQVLISFRDRSWKYGDGAFDMTRTFNGRAFRLKEHIARFYRTLRYLRLDPGLSRQEMIDVSEQIVARNEHLRDAAGDWWIGQRVSRGVDPIGEEVPEHIGPNVVVECTPLPLKARARQYRDGLDVWTPAQRRIAPDMLSPRAKTHNYLNMIVAEQSVKAHDPEGWAVLLDVNGNLAEGMGSNIFVVRDGKLYTPSERYVLAGIGRQMTLDLAHKLGVAVIEGDIDLFDAENAEEMFLTSTSLCIAGVRMLGISYYLGKGVPQDYAESVRWYRKAATAGDAAGQCNLGLAYANGEGVPQNYLLAHMWVNLSASISSGKELEERAKLREEIA